MKRLIHRILCIGLFASLLFLAWLPGSSFPGMAQAADPPSQSEELEAALARGPEAVVALLDQLHGAALDEAMDEIVAASEQLALAAPPPPKTTPAGPAEEEAVLQDQLARAAAGRAAALNFEYDPALDEPEVILPQAATDSGTTATLTVGAPPCTYSNLANALAAANPGDTLLLEGGVIFPANLSIQKSLTIRGGYAGCGSASSALTTLDGGAAGRVLYIYGNLVVTLENLNITNGSSGGNGAGIFVGDYTQLTGNHLNIYNNVSTALGGGIRLLGASATFTNTNIFNNSALSGGGVHGELINAHAPGLTLSASADVYGNEALTGDGFGGGVFLNQGSVFVADCSDIYGNHAIQGGGAYLVSSTLTVQGVCSEVMSNTASGNGGGIYAITSIVNLDDGVELYDNQTGTSGVGNGGGAYLDDSDLMSDKAMIYYNTAEGFGGGVYATNASLLDMDLGGYACNGPRCSRLSFNTAKTVYGGGAYANNSSEIDLRQIYIENNFGNFGGGLYATQGPVYLYNSLLVRNNSTGDVGDAIRLYTDATLTGSQNTLAYNDAGGAATGHAISMLSATLTMSNSIIWGHSGSLDLPGQAVTCSDVQYGYAGAGNLNTDPHFGWPAGSNFHPARTGPVIDACTAGQPVDLDNKSRPIGPDYDMGAYEEYPFVLSLPLVIR